MRHSRNAKRIDRIIDYLEILRFPSLPQGCFYLHEYRRIRIKGWTRGAFMRGTRSHTKGIMGRGRNRIGNCVRGNGGLNLAANTILDYLLVVIGTGRNMHRLGLFVSPKAVSNVFLVMFCVISDLVLYLVPMTILDQSTESIPIVGAAVVQCAVARSQFVCIRSVPVCIYV
jgi:hypothetical protein